MKVIKMKADSKQPTVHIVHTQHTHNEHTAHTWYIHSVHTVHTHSAHAVHTQCTYIWEECQEISPAALIQDARSYLKISI